MIIQIAIVISLNTMEKITKEPTPLGNLFENTTLLDVYNNQLNYKIEIDEKSDSDLCVVYFASNGIYVQNTEEEFKRVIIDKNRFEWSNNRVKDAKKHIFLRDIFKATYVNGINKDINNMHKIIEFLREETKGYRFITLGSSSGGYAALVTGVVLKAEYIFSFSGQVSIYHSIIQHPMDFNRENPFHKHLNDSEYTQYYNILPEMMNECNIPVFYFSSNQKIDVTQKKLVECNDNFLIFDMDSEDHRLPVYVFNFTHIINKNKYDLIQLAYKYYNRKITRYEFSVELCGFWQTIKLLYKQWKRKHSKK